jgi:acyl transferase domain-containing protein
MAPSFTEPESTGSAARPNVLIEEDKLEPIAVIGFGLKFPQDADNPENFWKMLVEGRSAMTDVPKDRWNIEAFHHPDPDRHDTVCVTENLIRQYPKF